MLAFPQCERSSSGLFEPSREAGRSRLHDFLQRLPDGTPARPPSSGLSPYLRLRLVREREVAVAALEAPAAAGARGLLQELGRRTWSRGHLEARPELWLRFRERAAALPGQLAPAEWERWQRARAGATGIAGLDGWARQLVADGWLDGPARAAFARLWISTLGLPWELGAAFFLEHLLDGDPALNTLGWLDAAGAAAAGPAAPIEPLAPVCNLREVAFPCLSNCPAGLLVCPEDLTPELGELAETPFSSLCVLAAGDVLDATAAAPGVRAFTAGAVADAAGRMAGHWDGRITGCERAVIPAVGRASPHNVGRRERMRVYAGTVDCWADGVAVWAANEHLKSVWMLQPPVGPWRDALPPVRAALRARGVALAEYRSRWDTLHWPHATGDHPAFASGFEERLAQLPR